MSSTERSSEAEKLHGDRECAPDSNIIVLTEPTMLKIMAISIWHSSSQCLAIWIFGPIKIGNIVIRKKLRYVITLPGVENVVLFSSLLLLMQCSSKTHQSNGNWLSKRNAITIKMHSFQRLIMSTESIIKIQNKFAIFSEISRPISRYVQSGVHGTGQIIWIQTINIWPTTLNSYKKLSCTFNTFHEEYEKLCGSSFKTLKNSTKKLGVIQMPSDASYANFDKLMDIIKG